MMLNQMLATPGRRFTRTLVQALCVLVAASVSACGGGSDNAPPTASTPPASPPPPATFTCSSPPEGLPPPPPGPAVIGGTIAGRFDPSFIFVALGDGKHPLLFYGPDLASTPSVTGVVLASYEGVGCSSPDRTAYNGGDLGRRSNDRSYLYTTLTPSPPSLTGTIRYANATYALAGGPIAGSTYNFLAPAKVADVVGAWMMTNIAGGPVTLTVDANGTVTGTEGCRSLTGTIAPSPEGLNFLSLQLAVSPCPSRSSLDFTYEGFALPMPLSGGGMQLLIWSETNNGVDFDFVMAIGRR